MIDETSTASPRLQARIAGFLYLIIIVVGAAGYTLHSTQFVWNDAAATARNILASEQLWRLSSGAMLVMLARDVAVGWLIYRSSFLPRFLGVLLLIAGLCYLLS